MPATDAPIAFDQLPLADAIKTVRGSGGNEHPRIAVFRDPGCSFCPRLGPGLAGLDEGDVRKVPVPAPALGEHAGREVGGDDLRAAACQRGGRRRGAVARSAEDYGFGNEFTKKSRV